MLHQALRSMFGTVTQLVNHETKTHTILDPKSRGAARSLGLMIHLPEFELWPHQ